MAGIKRLVRCLETRRYLTVEGWTLYPVDAIHFANQMGAVSFCIDHSLHNVELVLLGPDAREIFTSRIR